jgi:glycosyltransferase involved in cell wall biosynthesis
MLAIVIPYYKITFFEETLQSLASQTDQRFTVYIGDDASTENPTTLLEKFNGTFNFVYKRFDNNLGGTSLTQQWERCIVLSASEEWIMILGDDDVLGENVVEEFYKQFDFFKNRTNLVRYSSVVLHENYETESQLFEHPKFEKAIDFISRKLQGSTRSSLSEFIFKKSIYLKYKFVELPSAFYSDDVAWIQFSQNKSIFTINSATVYIRISAISLSGMADVNNKCLQKAKMKFLIYLLRNKYKYFDLTIKKIILPRLVDSLLINRYFNLKIWIQIYVSYLKICDVASFYKFHLKMVNNIIRK